MYSKKRLLYGLSKNKEAIAKLVRLPSKGLNYQEVNTSVKKGNLVEAR